MDASVTDLEGNETNWGIGSNVSTKLINPAGEVSGAIGLALSYLFFTLLVELTKIANVIQVYIIVP